MFSRASYPARSGYLRAISSVTLLLACLTLSASIGQSADPFGFDPSAPELRFDVPPRIIAHEVAPPCDGGASPTAEMVPGKLVRVAVPVSLRLVEGDIHRVLEVAIEIEATEGRLAVVDFAPRTTLTLEQSGDIEIIRTEENARTMDASLGGQLPLIAGAGTAQVTPSVSAGDRRKQVETTTFRELPPKKPLFVSGTLNEGRGAFFQLRPSSQSTLEGQHLVSATFRVPDEWQGQGLEVRCVARGTRKVLWKEQSTVWAECRVPLSVRIATPLTEPRPHFVAKPVSNNGTDARHPEGAGQSSVSQASAAEAKPRAWVSANSGPERGTLDSEADDPTP